MSGSLPLKYRPNEFEFVYGNDHIIQQVEGILKRKEENIPKSWLFTGESGCGKTTMVRIIRNMLGCSDANFHEYNSSNTRGIDSIREINGNARMSAMGGGIKIFYLDECHQLTSDAQNALLKVLEDTPKDTYFFLATTDPQKLKKAIKTRCTTLAMKECSRKVLADLCMDIAEEEKAPISKKVATAIGSASCGSPREALKILDQVIDIQNDDDMLTAVEKTIGNASENIELCQDLMNNPRWAVVSKTLKSVMEDSSPESIRRMVLGWFNKVLLGKDVVAAAMILEQFVKVSKYDADKAEITLACYNAVYEIQEMRSGTGNTVPGRNLGDSTGDEVPF